MTVFDRKDIAQGIQKLFSTTSKPNQIDLKCCFRRTTRETLSVFSNNYKQIRQDSE